MRRRRITHATLLSAVMLAAGASLLSAQEMSPMTQHAEIGTLERVTTQGFDLLVTTAFPSEDSDEGTVRRTYRTDETTQVEGLGSIMDVGDIPPTALGSVVVVTFVGNSQGPLAKQIRFTGDHEILAAHGMIESIDDENKMLVLRDVEGQRQHLNLDAGYGAAIDSDRGLLTPSELEAGQEYTVYYSEPPMVLSGSSEPYVGIARVLVRMN